MKKTIPTMMISAAIAVSGFALPTQAAVIDQVKTKVIAIKNDTGSIKNKVNALQTRIEEVSSSVHAQVAESVDIKAKLAPLDLLQRMKDRFSGGGFDPSEILEMVDTEELRRAIDDMKAKRAEAQERLNDPELETFRAEFLSVLTGINAILIPEEAAKVTPFQTLIEKAPPAIIALLKVSSEKVFPKLRDNVLAISVGMTELREMGVFEITANDLSSASTTITESDRHELVSFNSNHSKARLVQSSHSLNSQGWLQPVDWRQTCQNGDGFRRGAFAMHSVQHALKTLMAIMEMWRGQVEGFAKGPIRAGIHGYFNISFNPNKNVIDWLKQTNLDLKFVSLQISLAQDLIKFSKEWCDDHLPQPVPKCEAINVLTASDIPIKNQSRGLEI